MNIKVTRVDHIGVAVKNLEESKKFYTEVLGLAVYGEDEIVEDQKVKVSFLPTGDSEIELLESTSPDGPIAKYIEKNGEGIQHVALHVEDLTAALEELKEKGIRLIDEKPRYGAGKKNIAFIHPKATGGVLLELCEARK